MLRRELGIAWRTVFTGLSFLFFGIGALILGILVFPLIHLTHSNQQTAQFRSRRVVRASFRLFIWFMRVTGVLDYRILGQREVEPGTLVIANHPSLIDVIFVMATLPDAYCVVKEELARNPFTHLIVWGTGYPTSRDPENMLETCVEHLRAGDRILMFPEATRTLPGQPPTFRRGAGNVICRALCPTTPIFLNISPPTLAKGEPWLKVPKSKVQYSMEIGAPIQTSELIEVKAIDRLNARTCTDRLQKIYSEQLRITIADRPGADDDHGKPDHRYQSTDRQYTRT